MQNNTTRWRDVCDKKTANFWLHPPGPPSCCLDIYSSLYFIYISLWVKPFKYKQEGKRTPPSVLPLISLFFLSLSLSLSRFKQSCLISYLVTYSDLYVCMCVCVREKEEEEVEVREGERRISVCFLL